jgi:hypothetical protein
MGRSTGQHPGAGTTAMGPSSACQWAWGRLWRQTRPPARVGAAVKILGTDLTGATRVTFNGTAAKFTVISKSEIKTTVPEGATTGKVKVKRPQFRTVP